MKLLLRPVMYAVATAMSSSPLLGQIEAPRIHFSEMTSQVGIDLTIDTPTVMGIGAAAADADNDGDVDLWVGTWNEQPSKFYRNDGGVFTDQAAAVGISTTDNYRTALWFDCEGDKDLDLIMVSDDDTLPTTIKFYRQTAGGNFLEFTSPSGLAVNTGAGHRGGIAAGDINGDGYLDLYLAMWNNSCHLFLNNGDSTFTDITATSGVDTGFITQHQPMMADFNEDGLLDLYVAVDFDENHLWLNQGDLTFLDGAAAANADPLNNDMGMTLGDYDSDGDLDIFTTNIYRFLSGVQNQNVLLRNDTSAGVPLFTDVAEEQGVENTRWGWGTTFFDADNDGHLDLAATNGWLEGNDDDEDWPNDKTHFFFNTGSGPDWFSANIAESVGLADSKWGSCLLAADFDRDGDLDLFQTTMNDDLRYLENQPFGAPKNYFVVKPRMAGPNHRAIGATVHIVNDGHTQMRLIHAGTSYLGQEPAEAHFGVDRSQTVSSVIVNFPDGTVSSLHNAPANRALVVLPPPITHIFAEHGSITNPDLDAILESDNTRLSVQAQNARADFRLGGVVSNLAATTLDLTVEYGATTFGLNGELQLFNWNTLQWDEIKTAAVRNKDAIETITGLPAADYVNGDGAVDLRIRTRPTSMLAEAVYDVRLDQVVFATD